MIIHYEMREAGNWDIIVPIMRENGRLEAITSPISSDREAKFLAAVREKCRFNIDPKAKISGLTVCIDDLDKSYAGVCNYYVAESPGQFGFNSKLNLDFPEA